MSLAVVEPGRRSLTERFWPKVAKGSRDDCWLWTGCRNYRNHYGKITSGGHAGKTLMAHRVAWEQTRGPIPEGLEVLHMCDNPPCCNPTHLRLGTQRDNISDAILKGRFLSASTFVIDGRKLTLPQFAERQGVNPRHFGCRMRYHNGNVDRALRPQRRSA